VSRCGPGALMANCRPQVAAGRGRQQQQQQRQQPQQRWCCGAACLKEMLRVDAVQQREGGVGLAATWAAALTERGDGSRRGCTAHSINFKWQFFLPARLPSQGNL
jgi:hypothetical protein